MSRYKRCKMGQLPGDLYKRHKIAMLEGRVPVRISAWQELTEATAKSFKRDHVRKANRRFRRGAHRDIQQQLE